MKLRARIVERIDRWLSEDADTARIVREWETRGEDPCRHLPVDPYSVQPRGLSGYWAGRCDECRKPVLVKGEAPTVGWR